jgi:hypothetical protein
VETVLEAVEALSATSSTGLSLGLPRVANPHPEEPDAVVLHVRICGGPGWVTAQVYPTHCCRVCRRGVSGRVEVTDASPWVFVEGGMYHVYCRLAEGGTSLDGLKEATVREALAVVACDRYGVRVKDLARAMAKRPDLVSTRLRRGAVRLRSDEGTARVVDEIDADLGAGSGNGR